MKFQKGHPRYGTGMLGKKHSEETKRRIGNAQKGITKSIESNRKNSESHKGKKRQPFSEEWRQKIGDAHRGEKGSNWRGGKSFEQYGTSWTKDLKELIRERDNYSCRVCKIKQEELTSFHKVLDVHHIDYNKKNLDTNNLITLCRKCHAKTNHNREEWSLYFRTQGGDFGFPYPQPGRVVQECKTKVKDLFFNNKYDKQVYKLSWLLEKFWPVPGWTQENLDKLRMVENDKK